MAVLAFTVAGLYFLIAFSVVPRLAAVAQGAPGLLQVARWGATAFFAGCAVTHTVIGVASVLAAVRDPSTAAVHPMPGMPGMEGMQGTAGAARDPAGTTGAALLEHVVPHVAQIVGGLAFILIARRRLEWTVLSKDVAEGYRRREMQFRSAFERAPVGMALISLGEADLGQVLQANPALHELAGLPATERLRSYQQLVTTARHGGERDLKLLRAGEPILDREHHLVRADGRRIWVSVEATVVDDPSAAAPEGESGGDPGGAPFAVVQVRAVTDRRRHELLQGTQHAVARAVSEAADVDTGLEQALRALCEGAGWAGVEFWEADTGSTTISRRASWWAPGLAGPAASGPVSHRQGEGLAGAVWARGEQIWLDAAGTEAERFPHAAEALAGGMRSVIGLPILSGDRAAVLVACSTERVEPDRDLTTALEAICAHIGRFVELGRAEEFRRLVESAPDAVVICDPDDVVILVNARTEQLFGYRREQLLGSTIEVLLPAGTGSGTFGRRRDGSRFPVEIRRQPVAQSGGRLIARSIRDLTARHQAEELRFQLAAIVDSSHDAIIGSTLDGRITSWNRAAEEIFGYTEPETLGRPVAMMLPAQRSPGDDVAGPAEEAEEAEEAGKAGGGQGGPPGADPTEDEVLLARVRRGERVEHHDAVRLRRDGRPVPVSISMSPIRDPQGRLAGASRVVRDITQRKQAEAALSAAKESAEAANAALESFSYSVAHDLKAPLRSINGFSRILGDRYSAVLDADGLRYLELVRTSGLHMANLIDSLLTLSKVAYGDLRPGVVDLSALAAAAITRLRHESPDRQVQVSIEPGVTALGDATLLANVMDNLIGNAWKFTRNRPDARIGFGVADGACYVGDNGAGFDMAHAEKLFGVFQRLHSDADFEGTGVGLATVQRIVTRHGGRIWAESAPGQGATFRFTLAPADPDDARARLSVTTA